MQRKWRCVGRFGLRTSSIQSARKILTRRIGACPGISIRYEGDRLQINFILISEEACLNVGPHEIQVNSYDHEKMGSSVTPLTKD